MEKAGVQGEDDISFSKEDVKAAAGVTYNITIGGSVTGNIGPVSGHGRVDATSIGADTTAALRTLAEQITKRAGELNVPPEKREEIIGQASDLRIELAQSAPNTGRIGHILASIRSIAEIAAGDLVAAGILHVLSRPEVAALIERALG
jgi:hypothetical protein